MPDSTEALRHAAAVVRSTYDSHPETGLDHVANAIDAKRLDLQERVLSHLSMYFGRRSRDLELRDMDQLLVDAVLHELAAHKLAAQRGGWWRATQKGRANAV